MTQIGDLWLPDRVNNEMQLDASLYANEAACDSHAEEARTHGGPLEALEEEHNQR